MRAKDIMTRNPVCCTPETRLQDVAQLMVDKDCGSVPVCGGESNKLIGTITDRDIVCRVVAKGMNPLDLTVSDCMSVPCVTVPLEASIIDVCELLERKQIRRVAVIDEQGRICGIIAQADIAEHVPRRHVAELIRKVSVPAPSPSNV
jgi:CBS domain-containing protein